MKSQSFLQHKYHVTVTHNTDESISVSGVDSEGKRVGYSFDSTEKEQAKAKAKELTSNAKDLEDSRIGTFIDEPEKLDTP